MELQKGFLATLFDFSFNDFVTTKIIRLLYVLGVLGAAVGAIIFIIGGFQTSTGIGILFLVLSPVIFFLYVLFVRIWLELIIVIFRIAEHTKDIAGQGRITREA